MIEHPDVRSLIDFDQPVGVMPTPTHLRRADQIAAILAGFELAVASAAAPDRRRTAPEIQSGSAVLRATVMPMFAPGLQLPSSVAPARVFSFDGVDTRL
ncbi:hypothetical protein GCM10009539_06380 [Cryptosporangium japonicum]|uniref:Uncharacterized protein n=1 Tax=Cryptosporangium japonicum TaxID=80872 RepID=A0ABP3D5J3_9ACTN